MNPKDYVVEIYENLILSHKNLNPTMTPQQHESWVIQNMGDDLLKICKNKLQLKFLVGLDSKYISSVKKEYVVSRACLKAFRATFSKKN